jgi:hypothetical protein
MVPPGSAAASLTAKLVPGRHTEPLCPWPVAAPADAPETSPGGNPARSPERRAQPRPGAILGRSMRRRSSRLRSLARSRRGRQLRRPRLRSWSCAHAGEDTMAAFSESCRHCGHALVSLTDPEPPSAVQSFCIARFLIRSARPRSVRGKVSLLRSG